MALAVLASGMVTPVGYSAPASCAAIRVGLDMFVETRFMFDGEWLRAASVTSPEGLGGRAKLLWMARLAVDECLAQVEGGPGEVAVLVCVPGPERPGCPAGLDAGFVRELVASLAATARVSATHVGVFARGKLGAIEALGWAEDALARALVRHVVVLGVDSLITGDTLAAYHRERRLLTADNSDGFLPGEAAAALLLGSRRGSALWLDCLGIGLGREPAPLDSGEPLRADGLVAAYRAAFAAAGCGYEAVDYRLCDANGEAYAFKDAALALTRTMRVRKPRFDLWHPAECVGEVGAAVVPLALGVALAAARKGYAPGPGVLCHFADDAGDRAALVVRAAGGAS